MRTTIKEAISSVLEEKRLTQKELAKELGVSEATVSNYLKHDAYPALRVAAVVLDRWGYFCEPYTDRALHREVAKLTERMKNES